ncbi:hypothetical protein Vadar_013392 [Vaccinium darrowii]|uniref:Uncharacterized protein n=1 Tax=Vaccinium darrowii TaxID=229202 RepID=A0ACB7YDF6_9ERIC|nr:hypothetical protein Vadar_013392 [Vaccinium darrowii]
MPIFLRLFKLCRIHRSVAFQIPRPRSLAANECNGLLQQSLPQPPQGNQNIPQHKIQQLLQDMGNNSGGANANGNVTRWIGVWKQCFSRRNSSAVGGNNGFNQKTTNLPQNFHLPERKGERRPARRNPRPPATTTAGSASPPFPPPPPPPATNIPSPRTRRIRRKVYSEVLNSLILFQDRRLMYCYNYFISWNLREWRHFTYPPRAIRFSQESVSSPQGKDVTGGVSLPQFSAATVPKNGVQTGNMLCQEPIKDFAMYVGGPVSALDWCPRVHQRSESSDCHINCEFIAIAAHPPESSYHKVGAPLIGRGVIQIWWLLNIGVKEEEVPQTKKKAKLNQTNISAGKVKSPNPKKPRGRPRKKPVDESADNLDGNSDYVQPKKPRGRPKKSGNNDLYVQALAVQFPENASNLLPIDTVTVNTHECVAKKDSSTKLKACRRGSTADNLVLETTIKRRRLKALAREGNFVDPDHLPSLMENVNGESSPANHAFLSSVQDPLESSAASCVMPKDVALPRVVLCLAHNGKVAWDVKWRPSGIEDAESKHRMGYLAVLLGNGALESRSCVQGSGEKVWTMETKYGFDLEECFTTKGSVLFLGSIPRLNQNIRFGPRKGYISAAVVKTGAAILVSPLT